MNTSFGIGCFHFGLRNPPATPLSYRDYLAELEATLRRVTNINEIHVSPGALEDVPDINPTAPPSPFNEGNPPIPTLPYGASLEFSIHIPHRLQAELFTRPHVGPETFTERFDVYVHSTWEGYPIAFVEPFRPSEEPIPSEAIIVVREFLLSQLTDSLSPVLRFEILGPAPFHNDLFFHRAQPDRDFERHELFQTEYTAARGYDRLDVYYNPVLLDSPEAAKEAFFEQASDELGLYYDIIHSRVHQRREWMTISDTVTQIAEHLNAEGIGGIYRRVFTVSRLINRVTTGLAEFQAGRIASTSSIRDRYGDTYRAVSQTQLFQRRIDAELAREEQHPVNEVSDLVRFAESRRQGSLSLLVNLVIGVMGAILGVVATLLVSK